MSISPSGAAPSTLSDDSTAPACGDVRQSLAPAGMFGLLSAGVGCCHGRSGRRAASRIARLAAIVICTPLGALDATLAHRPQQATYQIEEQCCDQLAKAQQTKPDECRGNGQDSDGPPNGSGVKCTRWSRWGRQGMTSTRGQGRCRWRSLWRGDASGSGSRPAIRDATSHIKACSGYYSSHNTLRRVKWRMPVRGVRAGQTPRPDWRARVRTLELSADSCTYRKFWTGSDIHHIKLEAAIQPSQKRATYRLNP